MRTGNKQRFLDAVNHVERPDVAVWEMEADIDLINRIMGWDEPLSMHSFEMAPDKVVEWTTTYGCDMAFFGYVWHLGRKEFSDDAGRVHYVDGEIKDRDALAEKYYEHDLGETRRKLEALLEAIERSGEQFGLVVGAQTTGFSTSTAIGYETFCLQTILDPQFITDFQQRVHDFTMRELEMYLEYPQVDAVKFSSGLVSNNGPMISPPMMQDFEYRWLREQMAAVKAAGRKVIFHIDGNVSSELPTIFEMGVDVLNPIDPCGGAQSIYDLGEQLAGKLAICGNIDIDSLLKDGTPEEIKADVAEHIQRLAGGGGYIVASSHNLHELIPAENALAMRDGVFETAYTKE